MAAGLEVESVPGGGGVDEGDGDAASFPVGHVLGGVEVPALRVAVLEAGEVVCVPVGDKDGVSLCLFDDVVEGLEFGIMDFCPFVCVWVGVDGASCELLEFPGEYSSTACVDGVCVDGGDHVVFELLVGGGGFGVEVNMGGGGCGGWEVEVVGGFHG